MTTPRSMSLPVAAMLALWPVAAHAQQGPRDRQTAAMIHQAMDDYQNLEIDSAVTRLRTALRSCGGGACSPAVTAQVHDSLAIVAIQGQNDTTTGTGEFVQALQLDPNTLPDQLLVTPEITHAFEDAQHRAGVSSGGGGTSTPTRTSGGSHSTGGGSSSGGGGTLLHSPPSEQLENTPLPIFVENQGAAPAHVYLYFRGNGMTQFRQVEMRRVANGYGVEVPCGQVIQGGIDYYVQAVDSGGSVGANVASESSPDRVNIVTHRTTPAPSLPGQLPPETCMDECPPGMSGPQCHGGGGGASRGPRGHAGLGDPCTSNECGEGLHCDAGACSSGEDTSGGGGGGDDHPNDDGTVPERFTRVAIDVGGGLGFAFLSGTPTYAEARNVESPTTHMLTGQIDCAQYVCSTSVQAGFAPTYFLSAMVRVDVLARLGLAAGLRYQFNTWDSSVPDTSQHLANLLFLGRVYYAYTGRGFMPSGLTGSVFAGGGVGQIEPRPGLPPSQPGPSAHVISGLGNINAGARLEYGFRSGFHLAAEMALNFMTPVFLFDVDITAFVGMNF